LISRLPSEFTQEAMFITFTPTGKDCQAKSGLHRLCRCNLAEIAAVFYPEIVQ
jgi:hypothetical protein